MSRRRRPSRRGSNGDLTHSLWEALQSKPSGSTSSTEPEGKADEAGDGSADLVAKESSGNVKDHAEERSFLFFLGEHKSGKTCLLNAFLNPTKNMDKVKPTVALDYTYARKMTAGGDKRALVQIWELGGGDQRSLADLLPVVLTKERLIQGMCVIIVFDLNSPGEGFETCEFWLNRLAKLEPPPRKVIVGNKYDLIRDEDPLKKKLVAQAFRCLAMHSQADLVFMGNGEKSALSAGRSILSHYAFGSAKKKTLQVNPNKPVYAPHGLDSMEALGSFPAMDEGVDAQLRYWRNTLFEHFPAENPEVVEEEEKVQAEGSEAKAGDRDEEGVVKIGDVRLAKEIAIDKCFARKMKELEQYKRASKRDKEAR